MDEAHFVLCTLLLCLRGGLREAGEFGGSAFGDGKRMLKIKKKKRVIFHGNCNAVAQMLVGVVASLRVGIYA